MLGLNQYYAAPNAGSRRRSLGAVVRVSKVWVGDVPVALILAPGENVLWGVAVNRVTPAVTQVLDRLMPFSVADRYQRSESFARVLEVGAVYLSAVAEVALVQELPVTSSLVLRQLLAGALVEKLKGGKAETLKLLTDGGVS